MQGQGQPLSSGATELREVSVAESLTKLAEWFSATCNGDWEHGHGITISTLDNPGWRVEIDVGDFQIPTSEFAAFEMRTADDNWIITVFDDSVFHGSCSPNNLDRMIGLFLDWISRHRIYVGSCW